MKSVMISTKSLHEVWFCHKHSQTNQNEKDRSTGSRLDDYKHHESEIAGSLKPILSWLEQIHKDKQHHAQI
jgi:hypothetical protein